MASQDHNDLMQAQSYQRMSNAQYICYINQMIKTKTPALTFDEDSLNYLWHSHQRSKNQRDVVPAEWWKGWLTKRCLLKYKIQGWQMFPFGTCTIRRCSKVYFNICSLQWHHNGRGGVSNHQLHDCLLNRLFKRRSKKTSKLRVTALCAGNSPETGEFPAQMASNAENISIWWRHHVIIEIDIYSTYLTYSSLGSEYIFV